MTGEDNYYIFKPGTYKVGRKGITIMFIPFGDYIIFLNFFIHFMFFVANTSYPFSFSIKKIKKREKFYFLLV